MSIIGLNVLQTHNKAVDVDILFNEKKSEIRLTLIFDYGNKVFSPSARTFQYLDPFGDGVVLGVDVFRIQFVGFVVRCRDHHWRRVERLGECHVLQKTEPEQNQLRA